VGCALAVPSWPSLAALAADGLLIRQQVASEERWLESTYGAEFRTWASRVGRFTPWTGRYGSSTAPGSGAAPQ
jgi:protein-S-isoprenylcysteine O-methyltransferase Ste14